MLSGETSVGAHPVEAVSLMSAIASIVTKNSDIDGTVARHAYTETDLGTAPDAPLQYHGHVLIDQSIACSGCAVSACVRAVVVVQAASCSSRTCRRER